VHGDEIDLSCEILSEDGSEWVAERIRFGVGDLQAPADLARAMLAKAPPTIRRLFEGE